MPPTPDTIKNRIVGYTMRDPATLTTHPMNWRVHTQEQIAAVRESLDRFGILQNPIYSVRSGYLLDGHLRRDLAIERGLPEILCTDVDLDEADELLALGTFDTLGRMAEPDTDKLLALHAANQWDANTPALSDAMSRLMESHLATDAVIDTTSLIDTRASDPPPTDLFVITLPFSPADRTLFDTALDIARQETPESASPIDALMVICDAAIATP